MKLLTYRTPTGLALGVWTAEGVMTELPIRPDAFFARGMGALEEIRRFQGPLRQEEELALGPCVPAPGKIICIGLNYRQHAIESGMAVPTSPILFSKFNNAIAATGESVPIPPDAVEMDYEAELAVVIGKRAKNVSEAEALDYVLGYCNANDLSARDLQFKTNQWLLGKTPDKFLPVGPYLVTADEVRDPQRLGIRCLVNGVLRQGSNTEDMLFSVAYLIHYISQYITLEPGDLIATGTPPGVVLGTQEKAWLKSGDVVTVEIEGMGRLTNQIVRE